MTEAFGGSEPGVRWQKAKVVDIVRQTERIKSFFLELSEPFAHRAGQHIDLRLTAPDGYRAMRSYSIASAPDGSRRIEIAVELLDTGEVSPFFHEVLVTGDEIELRGPLGGNFTWTEADGGPLLLMGGGSGVVPLMAMIRQGQAVATRPPIVLLLSARRTAEVLYRDELLDLERHRRNFRLALTLTREPPRCRDNYGRRVDAAMVTEVLSYLPVWPKHVYICGSTSFVDAAADGAVDAGVAPAAIRTERYGVQGCRTARGSRIRRRACPLSSLGQRKEETQMSRSDIKEHMDVIGADGVHIGTVDTVETNRIKLTRADSGEGSHKGHHHYINLGLVADIEGQKVRLSANAAVAVTMEEEASSKPAT